MSKQYNLPIGVPRKKAIYSKLTPIYKTKAEAGPGISKAIFREVLHTFYFPHSHENYFHGGNSCSMKMKYPFIPHWRIYKGRGGVSDGRGACFCCIFLMTALLDT